MKSFLTFDTFITPKIIVVLYWITLATILISGAINIYLGSVFGSIFTIIIGILSARIGFELIMLFFKMYEKIKIIADAKQPE